MRVLCRSGHLALYPDFVSEVNAFNSYFGTALVGVEDYYTFPGLADAENFSIVGKSYLNLAGITNFQGKPWAVMRENGFVYSLLAGALVPKAAITTVVQIAQSGYVFLVTGLLQPGVRTPQGQQILSYTADFNLSLLQMTIAEYSYE